MNTKKNDIIKDDLFNLNKDKMKSKETVEKLKIYFQNPINDADEFKIILEINAIPFDQNKKYFNLDLLDGNSIIICMIESLFKKNEWKIILKLIFICKSGNDELQSKKNINDSDDIKIEIELSKYNFINDALIIFYWQSKILKKK